MFEKACSKIRKATYAFIGTSRIGKNEIACSSGTAFMIAPAVIVTADHLVHIELDPEKEVYKTFEVIRAPEIGQNTEKAYLIAEDTTRDIALLQIENPRSNYCVTLEPNPVRIGTSCGSLGFPLARIIFSEKGRQFRLTERFQGANISAFYTHVDPSGTQIYIYETDSLMYNGSSGCPGFLTNSKVFGMHNKVAIAPPKEIPEASSNMQEKTGTRLAISFWVTSMDIITVAKDHGLKIKY